MTKNQIIYNNAKIMYEDVMSIVGKSTQDIIGMGHNTDQDVREWQSEVAYLALSLLAGVVGTWPKHLERKEEIKEHVTEVMFSIIEGKELTFEVFQFDTEKEKL